MSFYGASSGLTNHLGDSGIKKRPRKEAAHGMIPEATLHISILTSMES